MTRTGSLLCGITAVAVGLVLAGCSSVGGSTGRDVDGRPIAPGPPAPTTCITVAIGSAPPTCAPIHNPPSRTYVEQSIPELLPTRGYGSVQHVRCTDRIPPAPRTGDIPDPDGLGAATEFSHWTCVGQEPEGTYLHEDVVWTPYSGYLRLNAVNRDGSAALTVPQPGDQGHSDPAAS